MKVKMSYYELMQSVVLIFKPLELIPGGIKVLVVSAVGISIDINNEPKKNPLIVNCKLIQDGPCSFNRVNLKLDTTTPTMKYLYNLFKQTEDRRSFYVGVDTNDLIVSINLGKIINTIACIELVRIVYKPKYVEIELYS